VSKKKLKPLILVEINRPGNWMFQGVRLSDEDGNFYEETTGIGTTAGACHHCGEKIKKDADCYRSSANNYFCLECITTIQMSDLWTAYHMRKRKVYYG
jgi:hypothetical protein